jgi:hypothetical protein
MIVPVPLPALLDQVRRLAQRTSEELVQAHLLPEDLWGIARHYGLTLGWAPLPASQLGCYLAAAHRILLNPRGQGRARRNFTFYHELMHHRIEHDDEVLSLFADATPAADESLMERLCDVGAAEMLMPGADVQRMVQQHGLSPGTIPLLCARYQASSIAVALQMVHTALHPCYLVIAGPPGAGDRGRGPRQAGLPRAPEGPRLVIQYTAASPTAKYTIPCGQPVSEAHPMAEAWADAGTVVCGPAPLPWARGRGWAVPCEALAFRRRVFAVFHVGLGERAR